MWGFSFADLGNGWIKLLIGAVFLGAALMAAVIFAVPWLWSLVRPWLHLFTA